MPWTDAQYEAFTRRQFVEAAKMIHAMDPEVNIERMRQDLVAYLTALDSTDPVPIPTWCAAYALGWRAARGR